MLLIIFNFLPQCLNQYLSFLFCFSVSFHFPKNRRVCIFVFSRNLHFIIHQYLFSFEVPVIINLGIRFIILPFLLFTDYLCNFFCSEFLSGVKLSDHIPIQRKNTKKKSIFFCKMMTYIIFIDLHYNLLAKSTFANTYITIQYKYN